jgi:hypothetical protein
VTRRRFDQDAGKHVVVPSTVTVERIFEPLVDSLLVECPRCAAKAGDPCVALSSASKDEKGFPHPMRTHAALTALEAT